MNEADLSDTEMVVTVLQALQEEMTADLADLESRIREGTGDIRAEATDGDGEQAELRTARTAIHSGLASIREVLGWIEWIAETDPESKVSIAAQPLPTELTFPIH
ncbi:hypothetical protein [Pseudoduganella lutea]|uniref:Uncharacterized protein n=1 Tax=Pseudoduganella lutea TaxID=321985 RepID=A0A4V0Z356_9BURK|nr:hypothetical protein [Pseudoduganella lutea]QBE62273.1 hypothetical protein EWM63_04130 [Pseudoduganella lutea]